MLLRMLGSREGYPWTLARPCHYALHPDPVSLGNA